MVLREFLCFFSLPVVWWEKTYVAENVFVVEYLGPFVENVVILRSCIFLTNLLLQVLFYREWFRSEILSFPVALLILLAF